MAEPESVADPSNPHRRSGAWMLVFGWILILGIGWFAFDTGLKRQANPNSAERLANQSGGLVTLSRGSDGHYSAQGEINGRPVTLIVDTGATNVALSRNVAGQLGLKLGRQIPIDTANGRTIGHLARLDKVRVGSIELHDIEAVVSAAMHDDMVLLGMSFLGKLDMIQQNNELTLRPR